MLPASVARLSRGFRIAANGASSPSRFFSQVTPKKEESKELDFSLKTGHTGKYILGLSALTTIFSQEYFIWNVEAYNYITFPIAVYIMYYFSAPAVNEFTEGIKRDEINSWYARREKRLTEESNKLGGLNFVLESPKVVEAIYDGQEDIVKMTAEVEARQAQIETVQLIKSKLDLVMNLEQKIIAERRELITTRLIESVISHVKSQKDDSTLDDCLARLRTVKL